MTTLLKPLLSVCFITTLLFISIKNTHAQTTQTIRGTVIDKVSQAPLPGAVVVLLNTEPVKGTSTDVEGRFAISQVTLGKHTLKITYMGYKEQILPNITVNAGKEVVLTIQLEEDIVQANEVVITANTIKNKPLNEMSTVSTRTFSVEETQKFAAAVNDPARMATSFAGVVGGDDGMNMIIIRGNSPNALLWRMEGVDIPNPNHYSAVGTSGGGISILSAQVLGNSDFLTGAFASEYGNAIGGVFDLKLRKGNNQKREHTFQAGVLGIDIASEGPFKKGYGGSYLINYRYSTLSLLGLMGLQVAGDARLDFQDLSFNVNLPTKKLGTFGVFGMGGLSKQTFVHEKDSNVWKTNEIKQYPSVFASNTGVFGVNNTKQLGSKSYLKTSLVFTGTENYFVRDKLNHNYDAIREYDENYVQTKIILSSVLTHKINAKNSIRTGFNLNQLGYDLRKQYRNNNSGVMETYLQTNGNTQTIQAYSQWNHKFNARLSSNVGAHLLYLALNNTYSVEPRASMKYDVTSKQYIALGYGLHSQIQPLGTYFSRDKVSGELLNKNTEFTKAHHIVLSHDISLSQSTHFKTEVYYQHLFNVPISTDSSKTFSMLTVTDGYTEEKLTNSGLGRNYGIEFTLERFTYKNFYYLLSVSLYESKYQALNKQWYNTPFNANYSTSFTSGKEWQLSAKRKNKIIGVNTKLTYVGGLRRSAINLQESLAKNETVFDQTNPYNIKNKDYFRLDVKFSIKRNYEKLTTTLSLDLQNATNNMNIAGQYFDLTTKSIKTFYQAGMIPVLAYKVDF